MAFPHPTTTYHNVPPPATDPTLKHLSAAGKIVLVTGGGSALGAATAEAFAKAKAKDIFLSGRRFNVLEDVEKKLSARYPQTTFHALRSDISKVDDVQSLFREINKIGSLDILVANAGYLHTPSPLAATETADWWRGFEINVLGTYLLAKAFLNQSPSPTGTPVFIGINTAASHVGPAAGPMSGYGASKLAAASVIEYLQAENPKLKAFNVHPGIVKSDMNDKAAQGHLQPTDSPELMAHMVVWLAGPDSDFLNGRFLWANWDIEELVKAKDKITAAPGLFRLTMEGWSNNFAALN